MTDLNDLLPSIKRAVAVPATFDTVFPNTTDPELVGQLEDGIAEAQLDGFLASVTLDINAHTTSPDLTLAQQALVVIYAGYRIITNKIRETATLTRYKAGPAEAETERTASMFNEIMRQLADRKKELIARAERGEFDDTGAFVADLAFIKATADYGWHSQLGLYEYQGLV